MNQPLLDVRGLGARTKTTRLLEGANLRVWRGSVLFVLGESGSGKTTLGLALQGEHRPDIDLSGSVRLDGVELLTRHERARRALRAGRIGYLPQHPSAVLNPVRRVGSVLHEFAAARFETRADRSAAVPRALETAGLTPERRLLRRYPHQLSGGEQQRVALAHTLIAEPELLVLDEPTTGLDTVTRAGTLRTLRELARSGTGLVLLTHDLGAARGMADEVLVLHDGSAVEQGLAEHVLSEPKHGHTRELLAAEPRLPLLDRIPGGGEAEAPTRGLQVNGLRKRSPSGVELLRGVDLRVAPGSRTAVVGRSGSGKTTLARCLAGLAARDSGRVELDGRELPSDINHRSREQRTRIQYVHQNARASFDEFRTIGAQLARTVRVAGRADEESVRQKLTRMLDSAGLDRSTARRRPAGLSGGQLQRAAVARALLAEPDVLVCDEITSAQDVVSQAELLGLLRRLTAETAIGLVLVSHDLPGVASLVDEILVLDAGRCVEHAPTERLLARPESAVATELVTAARDVPGAALPGGPGRPPS
ncbi:MULTISPECIES: ATP-binding cassette domain-containing protein [unclassified Actinopolyspora]|uniref:ABC transporter ATP-binding protein n=1 Tax=unclassified Actinopolyspora TaxID=2639451 RepID=UPI0013F5C509|nr:MULTISPECIES: ATP-binding cassette domain-containing protein [unclassified Actinopolyspora]NHD18713.1 ABC transporter ATP-binding protein [Actinopolyspora sp. BKK2]NHE77965.1 ABC transporter ATP-binding protein [Actinopolyspora sp. BKK1]